MSVNEYGEIGCLLQYDQEGNMVIEWRINEVRTASQDNEFYGWKKGDKIYRTSRGWMTAPEELVFMPAERERSLKPCVLRAIKYATTKWPGKRMETH